jgi:hypothetical protein
MRWLRSKIALPASSGVRVMAPAQTMRASSASLIRRSRSRFGIDLRTNTMRFSGVAGVSSGD